MDLTADSALAELASTSGATEFTGYEHLQLEDASIVQILSEGNGVDSCSEGQQVDVVLDRTPFYAESGGQIGDVGVLVVCLCLMGTLLSHCFCCFTESGVARLVLGWPKMEGFVSFRLSWPCV